MSRVDIPAQDAFYGPWIINFASVATANITALNMTSSQALQLTGMATAFQTAFGDTDEAKLNLASKVATKNTIRAVSEESFRAAAKFVNSNGNVSSGLKAELGITITPSSAGPVANPSELVAVGYDNGQNKLAWSRNGNAKGTSFSIEAKYGASGPWTFVAYTTKTKFTHNGQTPGQMVTYRIIAQRDDLQSGASNQATIYEISEVETFTLKQAA